MKLGGMAGLSHIVREQLHELQVDPGVVTGRRRDVARRLGAWRRAHKRAVLLLGVGSAVLLVFVAVGVVSLVTGQNLTGDKTAPHSAETSVSLGGLTVQMTAPSYQRFPRGQAVLVLHLHVQNTGDSQVALLASDLLLVDSHGSLFPPSWRDADGQSHDGLADSSHTLLGLDPGADARIDLPFLVIGDGPFTVRYQRHGQHLDAELPTLSLQ